MLVWLHPLYYFIVSTLPYICLHLLFGYQVYKGSCTLLNVSSESSAIACRLFMFHFKCSESISNLLFIYNSEQLGEGDIFQCIIDILELIVQYLCSCF